MRYRIAQAPDGHYLVLPAHLGLVPIGETYSTRQAAQAEADWLNNLRRTQPETCGAH